MKKGIILITIVILSFIMFNQKVEASHWEKQEVTWTDDNGNDLPQWYGQYKDFEYDYSYVGVNYNIKNTIDIPNGAKGVLFSVVFREVQYGDSWRCEQTYTSGGQEYCVAWEHRGAQNMSFLIMYNEYQNVNNCYWYDNTFTTDINNRTYIRGTLYCPLASNTTFRRNIIKLEYSGNVSTWQNSFTTYSIGFERTILFDVDNDSQEIINHNNTYDYNATQDYGNQTNEMDNITNAEDTLMNNLDFNTTDMNITINPNASTFIWNIVDSLRLMSTKIVLLMTSILSIGIIKLVLNR